MALGPGKYDALASLVRARSKAAGVVVMVFDGRQGSGFSVQASAEITSRLPWPCASWRMGSSATWAALTTVRS